MSLHREDIKRGIDKAAANLKGAVDSVAQSTKEVAQKAGDEMIEKGRRLKRAAGSDSEELTERQWPC